MVSPLFIDQIYIKVNGSNLTAEVMSNLLAAEVESTFATPSVASLRFFDDNFSIIDSSVMAIGNTIEIAIKTSHAEEIVFKGDIIALEPHCTLEDGVVSVIQAYDRRYRLNSGSHTKAYINVKDSDIINTLVGGGRIDSTTTVRDVVIQDNMTDLDFLYYLASRNNMSVFFDGDRYTVKKVTNSDLSSHAVIWGVDVKGFFPRASAARQVGEVVVQGWDQKNKVAFRGSAKANDSKMLPTIGINHATSINTTMSSSSTHMMVNEPVKDQSEANAIAKSVMDEIISGFVVADCVIFGNPNIKVGDIVEIKNTGSRFSGKYRTTSVTHIYDPSAFETHFTVEGLRPLTPARLMREHTKNSKAWGGVYPALVTNNTDPENLGRVKLIFPWLNDTTETHWARVTGMGAGNQRGLMILPEVNDEVLVAFEQGDFNLPYVIGGLWSDIDKPPIGTAVTGQKVEVREFRTREGRILRLTDGSGGKIELLDKDNKRSITIDTDNKKIEVLGEKNKVILDDQAGSITIESGSTKIKIDNNANISVTSSAGDVKIEGVNVSIKATGELSLEATGIAKLKGSVVNIN
ncbi:VgrG-related protein [Anaerolineales bacterium]